MLRTLLPIGALLLTLPAAAEEPDLARCAAIKDAQARLACYDALAPQMPAPAASPAEPVDAPAPPPASAPGATAPESAAPASDAERFGAESLPAKRSSDDVDEIESRLVGRFEGWKKGTLFELENGQVWRCTDEREVYWARDNPKVTIRRSFVGGYWLKVEGLNAQAKVRRVR